MPSLFDYHIHAHWCRHAEGGMEDYVARARQLGLRQFGISDHLPWPNDEHRSWTMDRAQLPAYVAEVRELQARHKDLEILLAVEADYYAGNEAALKEMLAVADFDYVIGSVHVLDGWGMDNEAELEGWKRRSVDEIWLDYFKALRESAATGLFSVIGHCDVAKKFNYLPKADMAGEMRSTAEAFAKAGVVAEINTSGLRKRCQEIYPSPAFLKILREAGVGVTLGSDAHKPGDVGADFAAALDLAKAAGYDSLRRWSMGAFEPVPIARLLD